MKYATPHWTDDAPRPVFTTVIRAAGPAGNVNVILGEACSMLHQLAVPEDRIARLRDDVRSSGSYDEAVSHVEKWFPVERD